MSLKWQKEKWKFEDREQVIAKTHMKETAKNYIFHKIQYFDLIESKIQKSIMN